MIFSNWMPWSQRKSIDHRKRGIYVLAHFTKPVPIDSTDKRILYIGMTAKQSFAARWNQFDKCAFGNGGAHSGAKTYREHFHSSKKKQLHVAAFPISRNNETIRKCLIRYSERKLLLKYAQKNCGVLPICNKE